MNDLEVIVKDMTLDAPLLSKAQVIFQDFSSFFADMHEWEKKCQGLVVTDVSQVAQIKLAREARLALKNIRVAAEKTKSKLKEGILSEGRVIDGIYNVIRGTTESLEFVLKEQEEFAERRETARKAALKSNREELLTPYGVDVSFMNLADATEESFQQFLTTSKLSFETAQAVAAKAEQERIAQIAAEVAERQRVKEENERLRQEAVAREAEIAKERAKQEAQRKAEQAKIEKERAEQAELLRKERESREAIEAAAKRKEAEELRIKQEKQEAERQAEAELKAQQQKAAQAPDKEKIFAFAKELRSLQAPIVISSKANSILFTAANSIFDIIAQLEQEANQL